MFSRVESTLLCSRDTFTWKRLQKRKRVQHKILFSLECALCSLYTQTHKVSDGPWQRRTESFSHRRQLWIAVVNALVLFSLKQSFFCCSHLQKKTNSNPDTDKVDSLRFLSQHFSIITLLNCLRCGPLFNPFSFVQNCGFYFDLFEYFMKIKRDLISLSTDSVARFAFQCSLGIKTVCLLMLVLLIFISLRQTMRRWYQRHKKWAWNHMNSNNIT